MSADRGATAPPLGREWTTAPAIRATVVYLLLTVVYTWPVTAGLASDVPWDMGDSLLNMWILGWGAEHLWRGFSGDLQALAAFWNANIFHPEPLTLAYSEHLFAQVMQILPVYVLTGNLVLCYNLLFLSTFVLAGLGMFLFVRSVTSSALAGFVAGLLFAFMPLRVAEFSHLQVMSSQWMPFALFGLRRYFDTGRRLALAGAAAALVAQNLSCGYFLLYFAPFVAAYGIWELAARGRLGDLQAWTHLAVTGAVVFAATVPFLLPYLELRNRGFPPRPFREVVSYSADVYSYLTASPQAHVAGRLMGLRVIPKPEGELFPSLAALVLASVGVIASLRAVRPSSPAPSPPEAKSPWWIRGLIGVAVAYGFFVVSVIAGFGFTHVGPLPVRVTDVPRLATIGTLALAAALMFGARPRRWLACWGASLPAFCLVAAAVAMVLSWGPTVMALGRPVWTEAPYTWLYTSVPGFDGLRVPARYAVIVMAFVSVLGGFGARVLQTRRARLGSLAAILLGLAAVAEGIAAPIAVNGVTPIAGLAPPPARLLHGGSTPPEYQVIKGLPADAVLVEFPFGNIDYELRYMYYSTAHWRRLVNGYSGTFPPSYQGLLQLLREPAATPEASWAALEASGASHAIVHEDAYLDASTATAVTGWLTGHGAHLLTEVTGAKIFSLPRAAGTPDNRPH